MRRPRSSPLGAALLALAVLPAQAGARQTTDAPPAGWVSAAFREIQRSEYEVTRQADAGRSGAAGTFQAPNRAQGLRTYFAPEGIRVVPRLADPTSWEWRASLSACGRAGSLRQAGRAEPQACNDRVEYRRDGLTEWYVNEPRGLEQGFTIAAPPAGSGPLALEIGLAGALQPALAADGRSVFFATPQGVRALEYGQLAASDARGAPLSAWFEVEHGLLRILVDDARAAYPLTIDPLITTPAWLVEGNQAYCGFGFAAATAGDINGDGHGDMIVGAPYYDAGQADEGRVFVYLGGFTVWTAEGNRKNALFGASVATAGDVNGDGYADVIVGETGLDGRVYVYHGGPAGLGSAPSFQAQSEQYGKGFGHSVGTAGDVNDDGFSDAIVGEPHFDGNQENEGRALVYHGSPLGLQAPAAWVDYGTQSDEEFGCCVATAGDVNGDARADVIVGAHGHDNGQNDEGRAFVYHGAPSGLAGAPAWTGESDQDGAQFGYSVGTAGDVDGDGCADVLAAAPWFDATLVNEGRAFVFLGSAGGLAPNAAWTADGEQAQATFGRSAGTAGDVNGDSYADVIVGAPLADNGETDEGRVLVYFGAKDGPRATPAWTHEIDQAGAWFGGAVATAGDVNGDGFSDLLAAAPYFDGGQTDEGSALVFLGGADAPAAAPCWTTQGEQSNAELGLSVASAGDVNGDGFSDVLVGAPGFDGGHTDDGKVFAFHGGADGLAAAPAWAAEGGQHGAGFGRSAAAAGDLNGDGFGDVLVGAGTFDGAQADSGALFAFHGGPAGLGTLPDWWYQGEQGGARLGWSVASAGDVNGDGYCDVLAGAPQHDNGQAEEGRALLFHGGPNGLAETPAWIAEANQSEALFGSSVAGAGDCDGDGRCDVIIGAPRFDNSEANEGRAFLFRGGPWGAQASAAWTAESDQADAHCGASVAGAGDVNGDGRADVVLGAPEFDGGDVDEGRARVYLGAPAGLAAQPAWVAEGDQPGALFGACVAGAGDSNGDGHADLAVGAPGFDDGHPNEGVAFVFLGDPSGPAAEPCWTAQSDQPGAALGISVATAGDVNGDGYADLIAGAHLLDDGSFDEGAAFLFLGNGGPGLCPRPRQRLADDVAPIAPLGVARGGAYLARMLCRSPFGRARCKLVLEDKPYGVPFDGLGTICAPLFTTTGVSGVELEETATGVGQAEAHHWRMRVAFDPVSSPFLGRSRWLTPAGNGWQEADLRGEVCPAFADPAAASYGSGKPGTNWIPSLAATTAPRMGQTVDLTVANGLPYAAGLLIYGLAPAAVPFDGGTLLVSPLGTLSVPLGPAGSLTLPIPLPVEPALCGQSVCFQYLFPDPGASGFYHTAQTPGLQWTLGD